MGAVSVPAAAALAGESRDAFYRDALERLNAAGVPYLVGGAFSFARFTGIAARTKDLDLFVRRADLERMLAVFAAGGYDTEIPFPHWLAKAHGPDDEALIDVIFNSGNGLAPVDDEWFAHAIDGQVFGVPVRLVPVEETIFTKAFIMERERFDGGDVIHLLRATAAQLDWERLLRRFGPHWPVLLSHLILFRWVYPDAADSVPAAILERLLGQVGSDTGEAGRVCRGPLLSRAQYAVATSEWGYEDARRAPRGGMRDDELRIWTEAAPQLPRSARPNEIT